MSTFKFNASNRYFNPICDSELLFSDLDGDTERIFCEKTTCIAPLFVETGVPVPCDVAMKPSGYTTDKFEWGLEGGPWTLSANYDGFTYLDNQFVEPFQFGMPPTGVSPCMLIKVYAYQGNLGYRLGYGVNQGAFSTTAGTQVVNSVGYQPMEGRELNGTTIDPRAVGQKIFKPTTGYGIEATCVDRLGYIEPPQVSYFNVGVDQCPGSNSLTFPDAPIALNDFILTPATQAGFRALGGYNPDGGNSCDGSPNPTGNYVYVPVCGCEGTPPTSVKTGYYSTDRNDLVAYRANPYNYNPDLGATNSTIRLIYKTPNGSTITLGAGSNNSIITGYRMQKYIQKSHGVSFTNGTPTITTGVRHLETKVRPLGYKVTWELESITPSQTVGTVYQYVDISPGVTGAKINLSCRGEVKIRITYTPIPLPVQYYEYGPYKTNNPSFLPSCCQPNRSTTFTNTSTRNAQYNPPWAEWARYNTDYLCTNFNNNVGTINWANLTSRDALGTHSLQSLSSVPYSCGFACSYYYYHWTGFSSHYGPPMSNFSSLANPKNPKSLKSILDYKYPLNWATGTTGLVTVLNGNILGNYGQYLQPPLPGSPNDFKIWRRKIGGLNSTPTVAGVTFKFSNRKEWFNGVCPFDVKYDNVGSDTEYHPTSCKSEIKPYASSGAYPLFS